MVDMIIQTCWSFVHKLFLKSFCLNSAWKSFTKLLRKDLVATVTDMTFSSISLRPELTQSNLFSGILSCFDSSAYGEN